MTLDICIIILTAFAIFGGYCRAEMVSDIMEKKDMPPAVIIMRYSRDDFTAKKVKNICSRLYNNTIVFVGDEENAGTDSIYPDSKIVKNCEISDIVTDVLFTKKL